METASSPRRTAEPALPGLANPFGDGGRIRAVLFDLDGTLYEQAPMRRLMLLEMIRIPILHPISAARKLRALAAYRHAQEHLRQGGEGEDLAARQLSHAAERSGLPVKDVQALVL